MTLATRDGRESFCLFVCFFTGEDESAAEVEPRNFTKLGPELVQVSARLGDDSFDTLDFFFKSPPPTPAVSPLATPSAPAGQLNPADKSEESEPARNCWVDNERPKN